jgi:hypothetical protein
VTDEELLLGDLALELTILVDEARVWIPSPCFYTPHKFGGALLL